MRPPDAPFPREVGPEHVCETNPYKVCDCGRVGPRNFGPHTRPDVVKVIEQTLAIFETLLDGEAITTPELERATGGTNATLHKILRLLEHLGYVEHARRASPGRVVHWRRTGRALDQVRPYIPALQARAGTS